MEKYIVNPVLVRMQESAKGSIYQSIVAMGFRARQINDDFRAELSRRLEDVQTDGDEQEGPNFDQLAVSREFDRFPKPTFLAMREISENQLTYKLPEPEVEEEE